MLTLDPMFMVDVMFYLYVLLMFGVYGRFYSENL